MEKIEELEERIKKIEGKKKGVWDILPIISSFLVPIAIFIATAVLSSQSKKQERQLAGIRSQMEQAELLGKFIDPLCATDTTRRKLAISAIAIAFTDTSKVNRILSIITKNDPDESVKVHASEQQIQNTQGSNLKSIIPLIFDEQKLVRLSSTNLIIQNHIGEPLLVSTLIDFAKQNPHFDNQVNNMSGIYNTFIILDALDKSEIQKNSEIVKKLIEQVQEHKERDRTINLANKILEKLK